MLRQSKVIHCWKAARPSRSLLRQAQHPWVLTQSSSDLPFVSIPNGAICMKPDSGWGVSLFEGIHSWTMGLDRLAF